MMVIQQLEQLYKICGNNPVLQSHNEGKVPLPQWVQNEVMLIGSKRGRMVFLVCTPEAKGGQAFYATIQACQQKQVVINKVLLTEHAIIETVQEHYDSDTAAQEHAVHGNDLFDAMFEEAVTAGATDILIDNDGGWVYNIKFEIDTVVQTIRSITPPEARLMMQYFYQNVADQDTVEDPIFSTHKAQFASGDGYWAGQHVRIRYQSKPSFPEGCIYSLRLLPLSDKSSFNSFEDLHVSKDQTALIKRINNNDSGATIVAGVTGSGKTTTIKILIEEDLRNNPGKQICTAESPPEYIIKGARQHHVGEDNTGKVDIYAETIKELMRMRPDSIYIGEVRSVQTAELFAKAVLTGHVVLTTIHTDSPYEIVTRLESEKLTREVIGSGDFITALIYQKRFPRLCEKCKKPLIHEKNHTDIKKRLQSVDIPCDQVYLRDEKGCKHCQHRGIKGTLVCMEVVMPNHAMRVAISQGDEEKFYREWISLCEQEGYGDAVETALYHALRHVKNGDISPVHIESRFGIIEPLLLQEKTRTWDPKHGFAISTI